MRSAISTAFVAALVTSLVAVTHRAAHAEPEPRPLEDGETAADAPAPTQVEEPPGDDPPIDAAAAILINPIGLGLSMLTFGYVTVVDLELQVPFGDYLALSMEPIIVALPYESEGVVAGGGLLGLRIAPTGSNIDGFYLTPALGGLDVEDTGFVGLVSLGIGYQWTWSSGFSMLAGGKVGSAWVRSGVELFAEASVDVVPAAAMDFKLGYAF